jgi:hypothetical protein
MNENPDDLLQIREGNYSNEELLSHFEQFYVIPRFPTRVV